MSEGITTHRFFATGSLKQLSKCLRMLGVDCAYTGGLSLRDAICFAIDEDRLLLSLSSVASTGRLRVFVLQSSDPDEQLTSLLSVFPELKKLPLFSRCLICNNLLVEQEASEFVPQSVTDRKLTLMSCPECHRIFWHGSHVERMKKRIMGILEGLN